LLEASNYTGNITAFQSKYPSNEMIGSVLSRDEILKLLSIEPPLVDGIIDAQNQIQPNGIDLTVRDISIVCSAGKVAVSNKERVLSALSSLTFDALGHMDLVPGCYLITYNEIINLPKDMIALGFPRSSLLRCGVTVHNAVWDAGYSGRSQSLMVVYNPQGFRLQKNARVVQLVFLRLDSEVAEGYKGIFQRENI
jgi:dUTP pyrophosphatase